MDRRAPSEVVGANVRAALLVGDVDPRGVAEATGLNPADVEARLDGAVEFTFAELVRIGGLLHVQPDSFFEGIAA